MVFHEWLHEKLQDRVCEKQPKPALVQHTIENEKMFQAMPFKFQDLFSLVSQIKTVKAN